MAEHEDDLDRVIDDLLATTKKAGEKELEYDPATDPRLISNDNTDLNDPKWDFLNVEREEGAVASVAAPQQEPGGQPDVSPDAPTRQDVPRALMQDVSPEGPIARQSDPNSALMGEFGSGSAVAPFGLSSSGGDSASAELGGQPNRTEQILDEILTIMREFQEKWKEEGKEDSAKDQNGHDGGGQDMIKYVFGVAQKLGAS